MFLEIETLSPRYISHAGFGANLTTLCRSFMDETPKARHHYELRGCLPSEGWHPLDTLRDGPDFGIWVHPERMTTVRLERGVQFIFQGFNRELFERHLQELYESYPKRPLVTGYSYLEGKIVAFYRDRPGLGR